MEGNHSRGQTSRGGNRSQCKEYGWGEFKPHKKYIPCMLRRYIISFPMEGENVPLNKKGARWGPQSGGTRKSTDDAWGIFWNQSFFENIFRTQIRRSASWSSLKLDNQFVGFKLSLITCGIPSKHYYRGYFWDPRGIPYFGMDPDCMNCHGGHSQNTWKLRSAMHPCHRPSILDTPTSIPDTWTLQSAMHPGHVGRPCHRPSTRDTPTSSRGGWHLSGGIYVETLWSFAGVLWVRPLSASPRWPPGADGRVGRVLRRGGRRFCSSERFSGFTWQPRLDYIT